MKTNIQNTKTLIKNLNTFSENVLSFTYKHYGVKYAIVCEGNIFSNCVLIAEAPGAIEEKYKQILIGTSGSIIRKILKKYGIENKVMFLNTVPWRPQNNATPQVCDIRNYSNFWLKLFEILNTEHVLCLGSVAYKLILIIKQQLNNITVSKTWHPAYYLRNKKPECLQNIDNNILYLREKIVCCCTSYFNFTKQLL